MNHLQQSLRGRPRWGRIEHNDCPRFSRYLRRSDDRGHRYFVLHEENFGRAEQGSCSFDVANSQALIGAGRSLDLFLTSCIDHHQCDARCSSLIAPNRGNLDPLAP